MIKFIEQWVFCVPQTTVKDCDDVNFRAYVNNPANSRGVRGFLAHKDGVLTASENETIAEILSNDEIAYPLVKKWLEYGDNMAAFKVNRDAGVAFGNLMKTELNNINSAAYIELKRAIPDLNQRTIYSQVQFCLGGDCISKNNYWIPDFVAVIEKTNAAGTYLDVIIIDAKLSAGTGWTINQIAAKGVDGWKIKSTGEMIKGSNLNLFQKDLNVVKNGNFLRLYRLGTEIKAN